MKIMICCSKYFYNRIPDIKKALEEGGHEIILPNSYDEPSREERLKQEDKEKHISWKAEMIRLLIEKISKSDAILVLNLEKNGKQNYIGGATFIEIFKAFEMNKKIFLYNPIAESIFKDELEGMNPIIINKNLEVI